MATKKQENDYDFLIRTIHKNIMLENITLNQIDMVLWAISMIDEKTVSDGLKIFDK